jgi:hypothetical protein
MAISRIKTDGIQDEAVTSAKIGDNIDLDGQFVRVPHGTTAQRPVSPVAGYLRFNTDIGTLEQWNTNTNSWAGVDSPPIVTSLAYTGSVTAADPAGGETITLTGTNFKTGATVTVGGTTAPTVSVVNSTTITFTTPAKTAGDYDVVVTNTNGLQATLTNGISYNGVPAFTTAVGNVGSIIEDVTMSTITIVAAEPDGGTLAYSITSGALPTGVSMSSVGAITGTPNVNVTSDTTYNFTVTATDDESQTNARAFNLIVLRPIYATQISKSARFDWERKHNLVRTPSSATTGTDSYKGTFSCWIKLGQQEEGATNAGTIVSAADNSHYFQVFNDTFFVGNGTSWINTDAVVRDHTGWLHLVFVYNTPASDANDRQIIYINGVRQTAGNTVSQPTQNSSYKFFNTVQQYIIGGRPSNNNPFDGYLADIHYVDGQVKSPTDFAEEYYGVWVPKTYSGTYGTNGFHLDFNGDSQDNSGNGNHWNPNRMGDIIEEYSGSSRTFASDVYKILDGDNTTAASIQGPNTSTSASFIYTPTTPITVNSSLKFKYSTGQTDCKYKINGGSYVNLGSSGTVDFNTGFTGTLTSIEWYVANSNSLISVYDLRVDDVQVINYDLGYNNVSDTPTNNFPIISAEGYYGWTGNGRLTYRREGGANVHTGYVTSHSVESGKWYAEVYYTGGNDTTTWAIVEQKGGFDQANDSTSFANYQRTGIATSQSADGWVSFSITSGNAATYSTYAGSQGSSLAYAPGGVLMIALDMDNNKVWYGVNGTWANSGDPAAGTGALFSGSSFAPASAVMFGGSHYMGRDDRTYWNFGVNSTFNGNVTAGGNADGNGIGNFKYSVPSGFLSLCSKNKAEVSMATNVNDRPDDYFNIVLWDANGSGAVDRSITGLGFQPDFVWSKTRDAGYHHALFDSLRGPSSHIATDRLEAQNTVNGGRLSSFDSDGFTWTANSSSAQWYNETGREYIAWAWKAGGAPTATNSAGSGNVPTSGSVLIGGANSTTALSGSLQINKMSVNTKAGFSIVQWTGAGGSAETIDHGLSQAPEIIITKGYTGGYVWSVYHENMPSASGYYMQLNSTNARSIDDTMYKSTAATNSVFTVGSYNIASGIEYVAYCWHSVEGYSKIGVFDGNGSADGTFVNLGFKPAFILLRNRDIVTQWYMVDNKIGNNTGNKDPDYFLYPNSANQQDTPVGVDFLAGGFKVRTTGSGQNGNNNKMLYMAFAEDPFKYSEAK